MLKNFIEPTFSDLLDDPLTDVIMSGDGVTRDMLIALMHKVAAQCGAAAAVNVPLGIAALAYYTHS